MPAESEGYSAGSMVAGKAVAVRTKMSDTTANPDAGSDLIARVRAAARQEQFLDVVSAEEARARFEQHLDLTPLAAETVPLAHALTRVLARDIVARSMRRRSTAPMSTALRCARPIRSAPATPRRNCCGSMRK